MGRNGLRNRSKLAHWRKGKTPVRTRRSPSQNGAGRQQIWQEKSKEPPAPSLAPNNHTRFGSPSPSSSISNHAFAGAPGDQAIRLHYPDGIENEANTYDGDEIEDWLSDEDQGGDLNIIIPDSLVDENTDICTEKDPCTPTSSKPCEVPLSPSPISLSADSTNMAGKEIATEAKRVDGKNALETKKCGDQPEAIENGTNLCSTTKGNNNTNNNQATQNQGKGNNKKGKRGKNGK